MTKKILGTSMLLACLTAAAPAMASTEIHPPWGNTPVTAVIGSYVVPTSPPAPTIVIQIIVWYRTGSNLPCTTQQIGGAGGLSDDYVIVGTTGRDSFRLLDGPFSYCGKALKPLVYGGHYLDLVGGAGDDSLVNSGKGDTHLYGQDGNDWLFSRNPIGYEDGGAGNDGIQYAGLSGSAALVGGSGNDCLGDQLGQSSSMDCGAGLDSFSRTGSFPSTVSCETEVEVCPL